jgi:hypothetical protein
MAQYLDPDGDWIDDDSTTGQFIDPGTDWLDAGNAPEGALIAACQGVVVGGGIYT